MYDEKEFGLDPEGENTENVEPMDESKVEDIPNYVEEEVQIKETVVEENSDYQNDYQEESTENDYGYYGNGEFQSNNNFQDYYQTQGGNKKKNVAPIAAIIIVVVIVIALTVGGTALVTHYIVDKYKNNAGTNTEQQSGENRDDEKAEDKEYPTIGSTDDTQNQNSSMSEGGILITDVSQMVENVMPSIVAITSKTKVEYYNNDWFYGGGFGFGYEDFYGEQPDQYETGAGSGIIVKQTEDELLVVTNNHVIEGADSLEVQFTNGVSVNCVMKGTDELADLAIVAIKLADIDKETMETIKTAKLGSSDDIRVGEGVVAIGNALGYGQSVTTGVISAKDREIAVDNNKMTVLQTDAAINGGNSGGALLNSKGEVIGINVAKYSSSDYSGSASIEGMGFAIPVSQAEEIIEQLMSQETRTKVDEAERGILGIKGITVDEATSEAYFIPEGIYISEVIKDSAAEKAGIQPTDVIVKFQGQNMKDIQVLIDKLQYYKAGEKVTLTIKRSVSRTEYKDMEVELTLEKAETEETTKSESR